MKRLLLSLSLAMLCASCATVREARRIQNDESARLPGEYTVKAADCGLNLNGETTLEQLEKIALDYNPSMLQARLAIEQKQLALSNAKAGYLPTLSASAGHTRSTHNTDRHGPQSTANTGSYNGNLSFGITLYDFGRTSAAVKKAQNDLAAAQATYDSTRSTVIYNVRTAYFELKRAFDLNQVAKESVQQYKEHLDQIKLKRDLGTGLEYDVTKAEVDYNSAMLKELQTANSIATGWADLNLALGLAENPEYTLGEGGVHEYTESADELMEIARSRQPELVSMRYQIASSSASVDAAIAELYPNLSLSLGASATGKTAGFPWLWNLNGGISGAQNLFNGFKHTNAIRNSAISLQIIRSQYSAKEQSVYRNLRVAVLTATHAARSYEVAKLTEKSAKENLDIVNEKFKYGKASSVDRTDAQVSYSTARAAVVTAHFDYQEAHAAIAKLLGE